MRANTSARPARDGRLDGIELTTARIDIEQEYIDVTGGTEWDPAWKHFDAAGHFHTYDGDGQVPTVSSQSIWEPCASAACRGDCEGITRIEHLCLICSEEIQPGHRTATGRRLVPGRYQWTGYVATLTRLAVDLKPGLVSIWLRDGDLLQFGIANLVRTKFDENRWEGWLRGASPLGRRTDWR